MILKNWKWIGCLYRRVSSEMKTYTFMIDDRFTKGQKKIGYLTTTNPFINLNNLIP